MTKRRGLIMYASVTGNTEKVAKAFAKAMEQNDWEAVLYKIDAKTNFHDNPVYFNEFDLVALGSPNMAGLPSPHVQRCFGMVEPFLAPMFSDEPKPGPNGMEFPDGVDPVEFMKNQKNRDYIKAVVFETYAGGVREATSVLAVLQQYLECKGLTICGQFACPGHEIAHMAVDSTAQILGVGVQHAADALQEYRENPNAPQFANLTDAQRRRMDEALLDDRDDPSYDADFDFSMFGKYDLKNRPHARDLLKAEIFMEEIVQDFFTGKKVPEVTHRGQYLCIS